MDISLNKLVEIYLNNTINLRLLSPLITAFHTHKMAMVSWSTVDPVTSLHAMYIAHS